MYREKVESNVDIKSSGDSITIGRADMELAKKAWELAKSSETLDENSLYFYLMMENYFKDTCAVAKNSDDELLGYLFGFVPPEKPGTYFVWQVGVDPKTRGQGIASKLLNYACKEEEITYLEATVTPGNTASNKLFTSFAEKKNAEVEKDVFIPQEVFGSGHEEEVLYRIGPFNH